MMSVIKFRGLFIALLVSFGFLLGGTPTAYAQTEPEQTELTPKCETPTIEGDPACWMKAENHDNCWFWNKDVTDEEAVTWSGQCRAGKPHGRGKEIWKSAGVERWTSVASYEDGQLQSESIRYAGGTESRKSYYEDGQLQSESIRYADGTGSSKSYDKDGNLHGLSTLNATDINGVAFTQSINYKHGIKHGEFRLEKANGDYDIEHYVNGKRHGKSSGRTTFSDGKIHYGECIYSHGTQVSCEFWDG